MSSNETKAPIDEPLGNVSQVFSRSAAAQIADQIVAAVREGRLGRGDQLPPERELAERFGVSRPTIREALTALELAGIVKPKKGRGTTVLATPSQVAMWGAQILPPQVFEARLAIEPALAELAAEKRYPEDIALLREVLIGLEAEYSDTGTYRTDLQLHRAVATAARNPVLQSALEDALLHTESELWLEFRRRAFGSTQAPAGHLDEARNVVQYIAQGKSTKAAEVWRQHLTRFRDEMLGRGDG